MSDLGTWLLFLHVFGALWLAAGAFSGAVVRAQVRRSASMPEKVAGLRIGWRVLTIFGIPGGLLTGILGIGLVQSRGYRFGMGWIDASLAIWLAAIAILLFVQAPHLRRMLRAGETALATGDAAPFASLAQKKLPRILGDVGATAIVVLTLLMVFKPV